MVWIFKSYCISILIPISIFTFILFKAITWDDSDADEQMLKELQRNREKEKQRQNFRDKKTMVLDKSSNKGIQGKGL